MTKNAILTSKISSSRSKVDIAHSFFLNKLHLLYRGKSLSNSIQLSSKPLINELDHNITQDEKKHSKSNNHTNVR